MTERHLRRLRRWFIYRMESPYAAITIAGVTLIGVAITAPVAFDALRETQQLAAAGSDHTLPCTLANGNVDHPVYATAAKDPALNVNCQRALSKQDFVSGYDAGQCEQLSLNSPLYTSATSKTRALQLAKKYGCTITVNGDIVSPAPLPTPSTPRPTPGGSPSVVIVPGGTTTIVSPGPVQTVIRVSPSPSPSTVTRTVVVSSPSPVPAVNTPSHTPVPAPSSSICVGAGPLSTCFPEEP